jgi:acid phosphatase type 7
LRSTLTFAAPGNHDLSTGGNVVVRNLDLFPDGLAYFYVWSQPLNGPNSSSQQLNIPQPIGSPEKQSVFRQAAGDTYPRMANYSFDYGNSHWTIVDGNDYMNWTDEKMRQWVRNDLAAARGATWRFVAFHQPPFNSDSAHREEQRLRLLADIFQEQGVDIAFGGHIHNYQRTYPMLFTPQKQPDGNWLARNGEVAGSMTLDHTFDGEKFRSPKGVIYIITGAGGAPLCGSRRAANPDRWQPFTHKFIADRHSFTVCNVNGGMLQVQQISEDGQIIDSFSIEK